MKELFEATDRYCKQTTWKTFAMLKTCLLSLGIIMGMAVPRNWKKAVTVIAGIIFLATYVPVMLEFCQALLADKD